MSEELQDQLEYELVLKYTQKELDAHIEAAEESAWNAARAVGCSGPNSVSNYWEYETLSDWRESAQSPRHDSYA